MIFVVVVVSVSVSVHACASRMQRTDISNHSGISFVGAVPIRGWGGGEGGIPDSEVFR